MADIVLRQIDDLPIMPITVWAGVIPISAGNVTQALSLGQFRSDLLFDAALAGAPTAPTPNVGDDSERVATTEYVQTELDGAGLNPATDTTYGTVRTNSTDSVPVVYLKTEVDTLLAQTTPVAKGGTGGTTAAEARANLSAAVSGNNNDITALAALASVPTVVQTAINVLVPSGSIIFTAANSLPAGWLACDGSAVSRTTYAALFAAIGTTYGAGNGTSTFNLPNLQGRVPMGGGTSPASGISRSFGATGGAETHTLTTNEMPSHGHTLADAALGPGSGTGANLTLGGGGYNVTYPSTANTGNGQPHNNLQPFLVLGAIIKI